VHFETIKLNFIPKNHMTWWDTGTSVRFRFHGVRTCDTLHPFQRFKYLPTNPTQFEESFQVGTARMPKIAMDPAKGLLHWLSKFAALGNVEGDAV
jgi:hypothetical protein